MAFHGNILVIFSFKWDYQKIFQLNLSEFVCNPFCFEYIHVSSNRKCFIEWTRRYRISYHHKLIDDVVNRKVEKGSNVGRKFCKTEKEKSSFKGQQKMSFYFIELKSCILLMLGYFRYHKVFHQSGFLSVCWAATDARDQTIFSLHRTFFRQQASTFSKDTHGTMREKRWKTGESFLPTSSASHM